MKSFILTNLFLIFGLTLSKSQSINGINVRQDGDQVILTYNLICEGTADITLFLSERGDGTFTGPLRNVTGDVGLNITAGFKTIIWNALEERDLIVGENIVFKLNGVGKYGSIIDNRNGNRYKTIKIGYQLWMAENLAYKPKVGNIWSYENNDRNISKLGYLYDWKTAQYVCPDGWILPNKYDFERLLNNFGGEGIEAYETLSSETSGFSVPKSGMRFSPPKYTGVSYGGFDANFWGSTSYESEDAYKLHLGNSYYQKAVVVLEKINCGLSVRCIFNGDPDKLNEFNNLSSPVSLAIAAKTVPISNMPVSVFVKNFVEEKIVVWQEKGEFEKTLDYQKRVNEQTRSQQIQKFTNEAIAQMKREYSGKLHWNDLILSKYDADNETYLIQSSTLGNFGIPVPVGEAQFFKQNFSALQFKNQDYYISHNKLILAKVDIVAPSGKVYKFDSKQPTTYSSNNITYNFKPLEVVVQQDNVSLNNTKIENRNTTVGIADVDVNIPVSGQVNDRMFVVIIANENYQKEVKVQFATNDGVVFKEYCEKTLGIPPKNIHFTKDASFGNMISEVKWISDVAAAFKGEAKLIFYYSGHGMPDENEKSAYLLPIDASSSNFETAIKLDDLYNKLNANPTKSVTVFLDACFSGSVRDNGMLSSARGVRIIPKADVIKGNMVVFSAATGSETAYPYKEKQHGLFTYYLLKKIQETKGNIDYKTLSDFIIENVKRQSIVVNQKSQTPQVNKSSEIETSWTTFKLN